MTIYDAPIQETTRHLAMVTLEISRLLATLGADRGTESLRLAVVRFMVQVLDPQPDHAAQDYVEILRRAQNVLAMEFHRVRAQQEGP